MNFIKNIINIFLRLNLSFLEFRYRKYLKTPNKNKNTKSFFGKGYNMTFSANFDIKKQELESKVEKIVQKTENNPDKLIDYVEKSGTKIYKTPDAKKILALINLTEGFIPPKKGIKAIYLNLALNKTFDLNFKECFVMRDMQLDPYYTIHQFYNWYAFKSGFDGYDYETTEKFNDLITSKNISEKMREYSASDLMALKEAIHRDVEALDFVINLAKKSDGAKTAFKKLQTGSANV